MACRDCGPAAKAVANCKTFTFPLGGGEVDIVFRGAFAKEDVTDGLPAFADFAMHTMAHLAPTRAELAASPPGPGVQMNPEVARVR